MIQKRLIFGVLFQVPDTNRPLLWLRRSEGKRILDSSFEHVQCQRSVTFTPNDTIECFSPWNTLE